MTVRYTPRYGQKKKPPERKVAITLDRGLFIVGTALVIAFLGYTVYAVMSRISGRVDMADVFTALAMLGLVVMLGAVMLRRWKRARNAATLGGFLLLAIFVAYSLYNATDSFLHQRGVGNAFTMAGMFGLLLLVTAGAMQRLRS